MPEGVTLTFNYNTTEYSMAEPFIDWVTGSLVGGFKNAGHEEQQKQKTGIPPHINWKL